jgi:crotonobetainyl-CoA:carnitine CoA-transferase CaiB-like acyl-CoA transferase
MLIDVPRADGVEQPVLVAGNPIKMSRIADGAPGTIPTVGQHTNEILHELLGLDAAAVARLRSDAVVS